MNKKILSLCIASAMLLSALPTTVFAASIGSTDTDKSVGSDSVQNQQTQYANFRESNAETEVYLTVDDSELLVSVPSTIILDGTPDDNGQYIGKYSVGVKGDMAGNKVVMVEPDTSVVSLRQDGKINNDATISQTQTEFDTDDFRDETVTDGTITATGLTAGNWNSEFNFNISISKDGIPVGYTALYEYDLSATENDNVKAYYAVPTKNTTPIDSSAPSLFSMRALSNENVVEYNGVRYELSDEDTLVISGTGNMIENLTSKMYGYQDIMNAVEAQFGIKCYSGSDIIIAEAEIGEKYYHFLPQSIYPEKTTIKTAENTGISFSVPSEVIEYIDSIKNNYIKPLPKNVIIKNGVTNISNQAFLKNTILTNITIPNTVTNIGNEAFKNCKNLSTIIIGNGTITIGDNAFSGCTGLTSITIPNSVISIGSFAFDGCTGLTSVTIPNSVTSIGNYAFYDCTSLTSVTIPNSVTSIGNWVFGRCTSLTSVTIPNNVTSIGEGAFYECTSLPSVTIPDSVTTIGDETFKNCSNLTTVFLGNKIENINRLVFLNCTKLTEIIIDDDNPNFSFSNNALFNKNQTSLIMLLDKVTTYKVPDSVINIDEYAFSNCTNLTSITIPNSVTSIGEYAFNNCTGLTSITIPDSVTSIGSNTFAYCGSLRSVTIPNSVTSIGDSALYNCTGLTSITIPDSVTNIGPYAFSECTGLTSITIPNSVTSIGQSAFSKCRGLTSITIPNSVTSIGGYAFNNLASRSKIYCQSQAVADLVAGKYSTSKTTVVVDASKF